LIQASAGLEAGRDGRAASMDLRRPVLAAIAAGVSGRSAGRRFGVSAPRPVGGDHRSHRTEAHVAAISSALEAAPDLTLEALRENLAEQRVFVSYGALRRFLDRDKITRNKDRARQRAGSTGHRVAPRGLVRGTTSIRNASSFNMARRSRRPQPRAQRLRMSVPHGHWKTTTSSGAD
jgi:hypothetical protein